MLWSVGISPFTNMCLYKLYRLQGTYKFSHPWPLTVSSPTSRDDKEFHRGQLHTTCFLAAIYMYICGNRLNRILSTRLWINRELNGFVFLVFKNTKEAHVYTWSGVMLCTGDSYFKDTDPENDLLNQKHISVSSVTNYFDAKSWN